MADKKPKRTRAQQVINGLTRGLISDTLGAPVDLATLALNAPGQIYGAVRGQPAPYEIKRPVGGSDFFAGLLDSVGVTYDDGEDTSLLEDAVRLGSGIVGPTAVLKGAQALPQVLPKIPDMVDDLAYRAMRNSRPTYTNIESATTPIPYGSEKAAEVLVNANRGIRARGRFPGDPALHEQAMRGTVGDLSRPNVQPSIGSWTEDGINYTNPASSVNLGRGIREFGGYGGPIPAEVAQTAGELQQTGAGLSRFTPSVFNRPKGFFRDAEFRTTPTPQTMRQALDALAPSDHFMGDQIYGRFLQHVPQEGVVRGHNLSPNDVRALEQVFGTRPRFGRADTVYNDAYPLARDHRAAKEGLEFERRNTRARVYEGHHSDGGGVQAHSAGDIYPYGIGHTEDGRGFVFGPNIDGYLYLPGGRAAAAAEAERLKRQYDLRGLMD